MSGNSSRSGHAFPWIGHTLIAAVLVVAAGVGLARAAAPAMQLLLDIVINGNDTRQIGSFMQKGNSLLASRTDLRALGLILPPAGPGDTGKTLIALNRLKNVSYRLDQATQTVDITATAGGINPTQLNRFDDNLDDLPVQSSTGALMSYDVLAQSQFGQGAGQYAANGTVSSAFDMRVFNPLGVIDTSFLASNDAERPEAFVRLDSSYSYSDPSNLRQYQLGDFINGSLAWTRAVRLGGMQIATNFAIDPDLITYPLPMISGQAAVPSSVDVLVNGVRQLSSQVNAGPFEVNQLPVVNGSGEVSVVVKNALGQQVVETLPFYVSEIMLAPGLSSYSVETGFVRRAYGLLSDDYKTPAASASWRYGVTPWLTVEAHGEGTNTLAMGGAGVIVTLDNEVLVSLADAVSKNAGRTGMQYAVQVQHNDPIFNVDASLQEATPGFRDIAAVNGDPVPTMILQAGGGVSDRAIGSLGVNFTKIESPEEHDAILTLSYSRQLFNRAYAFVDAFRDFSRHGGDGVVVSFSMTFGDRGSVSLDPNVNNGQYATQVQAVEATPDVGDVGGRVLASDGQGQPAHEYGELDYKSPFGQFGIGVDHQGTTQTVRATADGSIALADGSVFATNTIYDSFAVVDTGGVKGIDVTDENRPYGKTGSSGKLLIPDLDSFNANHIGIDPDDIPINDSVGALTQIVRPQDRSGVVVRFPIRPSDGAVLQLVDAAGKSLPVGSAATLQGTSQQTIVGYQGEVFLQGLQPRNVVTVMRPDGSTCSSVFSFKAQSGSLPTIGPLVCRASAKP